MRALPILTVSCAVLAGLPTAGQETPFGGEQEVTAVDVALELSGGGTGWLPGRRSPGAGDLSALVDGAPVPVVAVQPPKDRFERVVIYVDLPLSDDYQLTWSALLLADRASRLVKLGPVEVVVAAPQPRTVLSPTRDAAALEEALARLAFFGEAQDRLVELRLEDGAAAPEEPADERELVQRRLDALLLSLVARTDGPDPRRAAILLSGGFDLDGAPGIGEATVEVGRVLAAYGWRLLPLLAPEQAGPLPGVRIGKWRFFAVVPPHRQVSVPSFLATREEDRDPELAESHLGLAEVLQDQGELERAAEEAEAALKHFAGDPRTADRQAATLVLLSEVHEALGDPQRARRDLRRAARFDSAAVAGNPIADAVPEGAAAALAVLAEAGGGTPLRSDGELDAALSRGRLGRRSLITIQMPGAPDEALHQVEIRSAGGDTTLATGWLRYGTPQQVTEARIRQE